MLNMMVINFHIQLLANLYHLAFQLIIWYVTIVPSPILFQLGLAWHDLVLKFAIDCLMAASLLFICWFAISNLELFQVNLKSDHKGFKDHTRQ